MCVCVRKRKNLTLSSDGQYILQCSRLHCVCITVQYNPNQKFFFLNLQIPPCSHICSQKIGPLGVKEHIDYYQKRCRHLCVHTRV